VTFLIASKAPTKGYVATVRYAVLVPTFAPGGR
jgi:hypothetical protein